MISFECPSLILLSHGFLFFAFKFLEIRFESKIFGSHLKHVHIQKYHANYDSSLNKSDNRNLVDGELAGMPFNKVVNNLHFSIDTHRIQYHE